MFLVFVAADSIIFVNVFCQTVRRLAQNREAARKSRLRKKVIAQGREYLCLISYSEVYHNWLLVEFIMLISFTVTSFFVSPHMCHNH